MDRILLGREAPYTAGIPKKKTTEELRALDVRKARRGGFIAPGQEALVVPDGPPIPLVWAESGFGEEGRVRPWFICPGTGCGRRVAILYLGEQERHLLCRRCLQLAYPSQSESELLRARRRLDAARSRLGPAGSPRPKGMHKRTFLRLLREYERARQEQAALKRTEAGKLAARIMR